MLIFRGVPFFFSGGGGVEFPKWKEVGATKIKLEIFFEGVYKQGVEKNPGKKQTWQWKKQKTTI